MTLPARMNQKHVMILSTLAEEKEQSYVAFRDATNPWRRESYFDGEMRWFSNIGLVLFTGKKTILITEAGKELIQSEGKDAKKYDPN